MSEEIIRILDMVKSGKITVEEGEKLIAALSESNKSYESVEVIEIKKKKATMLRIRIEAGEGSEKQANVNVNLPLSIAKKMAHLVSMIPKDASQELENQGINLKDIDLVELIEAFENGEIGEELVNIEAGQGDQKAVVKIYVD